MLTLVGQDKLGAESGDPVSLGGEPRLRPSNNGCYWNDTEYVL